MQLGWVTNKEFPFYCGQHAAVDRYNAKITERREKYSKLNHQGPREFDLLIEQINTVGYAHIKNFFTKEELEPLTIEFEDSLATGRDVKLVQDGNHIQMNQPFLNSENVLKLGLNKKIVDIATAYYRCIPALGTCNLRRSSAEYTRAFGTNKFHRDFNSPVKFIKFFIYLNDVNMDNGPFTYVKGSNTKMPQNWQSIHRWEDSQIINLYGEGAIAHLTASYGDLLMATTNGFHKGSVPKVGTRDMLTLNYVIAPELRNQSIDEESSRFLISEKSYDSLKPWQLPLVDFLNKVEK